MKRWIAMLTALVVTVGVSTADLASAAKIITVPQGVRSANAADLNAPRRRAAEYADPYGTRAYDQPYAGGWTYYYGRPYYYAPAPFPFGFDFGFASRSAGQAPSSQARAGPGGPASEGSGARAAPARWA